MSERSERIINTVRSEQRGWAGRLFFGPWWLVYSGAVGPTEAHRHHALQVVLVPGVRVVDDDGQHPTPAVVAPDRRHALAGEGLGSLVFVDPDATGAPRGLARSVPDGLLARNPPRTMDDARDLAGLVTLTRPVDRPDRHPAVAWVLDRLPDNPAASLGQLATSAGVSPDRLTHLFTEQVGIPVRAYRRWVRLLLAADALRDGATLNDAAHQAGFADAAHLHRTFRDQFGLRPGRLLPAVEWVTS
jgi:AraC-like DNA-binding protein